MRVSVCVGNYTETPYLIVSLGTFVHCIEELCYGFKENAFLLDTSIMNDTLVDWIANECELKELARELYPMVHKQGSLSAFVGMIMEYVGLYDEKVIRDVESVLKKGAGLSGIEKRKNQIDYLVKKKKYVAALRSYDMLLSQWEKYGPEEGSSSINSVRTSILHNKGVVYTKLMQYTQAAACFLEAYEQEPIKEHYMAYLASKRLELKEADYISFAAEHPESYEYSIELEGIMEKTRKEFESQPEFQILMSRKEWREGSQKQKYYEENERLIQAMKSSYRNSVSE